MGRDPQRQSASIRRGAHFWDAMPLETVLIKKHPMEQISTAQPSDMGQGMMCRIWHALGTRPGELDFHSFLLIYIDFRGFSLIFTDFRSSGVQNAWKSRNAMFYVCCLFTSLYRRFRLSRVSQAVDLKESINWYQKLFISCVLARCWAAFVLLLGISQPRHRKAIEILSKFYWNSIEILLKSDRSSIEILSKLYRDSIEILWKFYRDSIEFLQKFFRKSMEILSKIYRHPTEILSKF